MLRNRPVGSKKVLMAEYTKTSSSSSLFPSPRLLLRSLSGKTLESETSMSPTSILEARNFSSSGLSLLSIKPISGPTEPEINRRIGLGIVDALDTENTCRVLTGRQLKIQIPNTPCPEFPSSPIEFGIKTKPSLLKSASSFTLAPTDCCSPARTISELSEDYTCVITHGPNPRTTHIFEDYIVESTGDDLLVKVKDGNDDEISCSSMDVFLSFCYSCNKGLRHGSDTFMYRGEQAFCSEDCRSKRIECES